MSVYVRPYMSVRACACLRVRVHSLVCMCACVGEFVRGWHTVPRWHLAVLLDRTLQANKQRQCNLVNSAPRSTCFMGSRTCYVERAAILVGVMTRTSRRFSPPSTRLRNHCDCSSCVEAHSVANWCRFKKMQLFQKQAKAAFVAAKVKAGPKPPAGPPPAPTKKARPTPSEKATIFLQPCLAFHATPTCAAHPHAKAAPMFLLERN